MLLVFQWGIASITTHLENDAHMRIAAINIPARADVDSMLGIHAKARDSHINHVKVRRSGPSDTAKTD